MPMTKCIFRKPLHQMRHHVRENPQTQAVENMLDTLPVVRREYRISSGLSLIDKFWDLNAPPVFHSDS